MSQTVNYESEKCFKTTDESWWVFLLIVPLLWNKHFQTGLLLKKKKQAEEEQETDCLYDGGSAVHKTSVSCFVWKEDVEFRVKVKCDFPVFVPKSSDSSEHVDIWQRVI